GCARTGLATQPSLPCLPQSPTSPHTAPHVVVAHLPVPAWNGKEREALSYRVGMKALRDREQAAGPHRGQARPQRQQKAGPRRGRPKWSVSRPVIRVLLKVIIYLGCQLPGTSSDLPEGAAGHLILPPARSCSGWGLPSRPVAWPLVSSYLTVSALPARGQAVCFLWHFP